MSTKKQVNVWMDEELLTRLEAEAVRRDRSRAFVVCLAVERLLRTRQGSTRGKGTPRSGEGSRVRSASGQKQVDSPKQEPNEAPMQTQVDSPVLPYNPLIDFIESKELSKALVKESSRGRRTAKRKH